MRIYIFAVITAMLALTNSTAQASSCYNVGTWNLEHFGFGKTRGFPENTRGGPTYQAHTSAHRDAIANVIKNKIDAKILVLNEINGRLNKRSSKELDDLRNRLGASWKYTIGLKGGRGDSQRVAILWDSKFARAEKINEIYIKKKIVNGGDIFNRDPLVGRFTFLKNGTAMNDLVVVGLHLASGQGNAKNHDAAMYRLRGELRAIRGKDNLLPKFEDDIILAGDLNANAFKNPEERFFTTFNRGNWRVLAKKSSYSGTRLKGVSLKIGDPIDYIIATNKSARHSGLVGEELPRAQAKVWTSLISNSNYDKYRKTYSDHLPVSVCVKVMADND